MKKLLILLVATAVYLHFYPQSAATAFYNKAKDDVLSFFSKISDTKIRLKPDKIYTELSPKFTSFSDTEITHLEQITSSRTNVKEFYTWVCVNKTRDHIFHFKNQQEVCKTIKRYHSLL